MKQGLCILISLVLLTIGATLAISSQEVKEKIIFNNKKGEVVFLHKKHSEKFECKECHHKKIKACSECHKEKDYTKKMHKNCKTCHKKNKKSTSCKSCHKRKQIKIEGC